MHRVMHHIIVNDRGSFCSCKRTRETPDRRNARDWANEHFKRSECAMLTDESLNP